MVKSRSVVTYYYLFQLFFQLLIWIPIFYQYQKNSGLNDGQIFGIQSIYYLFFCLLEIPTGLVADLWGYRRCLRYGSAIFILSNLIPAIAPSYLGFLIHFLTIALARSFISGAATALMYEHLAQNNQAADFKRIEGNARALALYGRIACWASVGFIFAAWPEGPYILTAIGMCVAFYSAMMLPDVHPAHAKLEKVTLPRIFRNIVDAVLIVRNTPQLFYVMLQGVTIFVLARLCEVNLFQPILRDKSIPVQYFGTILAAVTVFESFGAARQSLLLKKLNITSAIFLVSAVMAISLGIIPWLGTWSAIAALCVFGLFAGFAYPLQRQLLNDVIPDSRYRATLISIESIIDRAVTSISAAVLGIALQAGKMAEFLGATMVVVLVLLAILFSLVRKSTRVSTTK